MWLNLAQIYLEATMVHCPEVSQVVATMNVNTVQKSSRFKGILSVKFSDVSLAQKPEDSKGLYWWCSAM